MATMNISLPDSMRDWVNSRIDSGVYANNSDYIRDLIRRDQMDTIKLEALQKAITAGLESGPAKPLNMAEIKRKARLKAGL